MRICIFGAGAIGGFAAVLLARAGQDVSVIARGPQLEAIRADGLRLDFQGERLSARVEATDDPAALPPQDYVLVAVKAPALPGVARTIAPLLAPETTVVTAMNGIPWWFFDGFGAHHGLRLAAVDPDGALAAAIPAARVLGCVLHIACSVPEPGLVVHNSQNRFVVGEPDGRASDRARALVDAMVAAGIGGELTAKIQQEVWLKLLGNMNFAPVSMLTEATNDQVAGDPDVRAVMRAMFDEADRVGRHFGLDAGITADERIDMGGGMIGFRTSMLQDYDKGRPVELDSIVRAIAEMGDVAGIETPTIDAVLALAAQKATIRGIYTPPAA
jgi:2-dehydropantoate 2-reductase